MDEDGNNSEIGQKKSCENSVNKYATIKTVGITSLNLALLTSNGSHLKHVVMQGPNAQHFYPLMVCLLSFAIILEVAMVIMTIIVGTHDINKESPNRTKIEQTNTAVTVMAVFITVIDILVATFETEHMIPTGATSMNNMMSSNDAIRTTPF